LFKKSLDNLMIRRQTPPVSADSTYQETAMTSAVASLNGVDVDRLVETVNAITSDTHLASFQFRARTEWESGGRSRTTITDFSHAGAVDNSRAEPFELVHDEPPLLLGSNAGPNAVEAVLGALASCLAVGYAYNAAARGIALRRLSFELEGDLDLRGFLGLADGVRPGFSEIRVRWRADSDASREQLEELCDYVQRTSPMLDLLRNPTAVAITLGGRSVDCPCGHVLRGLNDGELLQLARRHVIEHHPGETRSDDEIREIIAAHGRDD
jgi:uncharacterized OsmC-like protein